MILTLLTVSLRRMAQRSEKMIIARLIFSCDPFRRAWGRVERVRMAQPRDASELKEGARLVRQVLKAIPPELDDQEDAVLRKLVEGMASAANMAARSSSGGPSAE